jgi:hypothetical protein
MNDDRKDNAGKSGFFTPFMLAIAVLAISATGAVIQLAPAKATSRVATDSPAVHAAVGEGSGYLPAQYVNRATEIAPMVQEYSTN